MDKKELADALLDAFSKDTLKQMLFYQLDRRLDEISTGDNLQKIVSDVVSAAEQQSWLDDLIISAVIANPGNEKLQSAFSSFSKSFRTRTVVSNMSQTPYQNDIPSRMALVEYMLKGNGSPGIAGRLDRLEKNVSEGFDEAAKEREKFRRQVSEEMSILKGMGGDAPLQIDRATLWVIGMGFFVLTSAIGVLIYFLSNGWAS